MLAYKLCISALLTALCLSACIDDVDDEEVGVDTSHLENSFATGTYFSLRPDFRRCLPPACGGYFVKRLNRPTTRCANGTSAAECYVATIDLAALALDDAQLPAVLDAAANQRLLLRGSVVKKDHGNFGQLGELQPSEAWMANNDNAPSGSFRLVTDPGVLHQAVLNHPAEADLHSLDFSPSDATQQQVSQAIQASQSPDGLIIAGTLQHRPEGYVALVGQFYRRVTAP